MANKNLNIRAHKAITTAILNAAGASWDDETQSIVTIHGRDVLFDKKDPLAIAESKAMIARAVIASLNNADIQGMQAVNAVMFRGGESAISNYRLMKMFDPDIDAAADDKLYKDCVGSATASKTWGQFGRISIDPIKSQPGAFRAFITCCQDYREHSDVVKRWNKGGREQQRVRNDLEFVTEYNNELARIEGAKSTPAQEMADRLDGTIPELREPTSAGILMLIENDSYLAWTVKTAHTDFLQVEFEVDKVNLIEPTKTRVSDAFIKSKDNLFGTTADTVYDSYIRALVVAQAKKMYPMQAITCNPDDYVMGSTEDGFMICVRREEDAPMVNWNEIGVVKAVSFGAHLVAATHATFSIERVNILCHSSERNRHVLNVIPKPIPGIQSGLWQNSILADDRATCIVFMTDKSLKFWFMPGHMANTKEHQSVYREKIHSALLKVAGKRNVKLSWEEDGEAMLAHFTDPDENNNTQYLAYDIRDISRIAIAEADKETGNNNPIPELVILSSQYRAFELSLQDESTRGLEVPRAILNAMRRTFSVHDIPNIPGKAGDFFRKLEEFNTVSDALEYVKEVQEQMYREHMKKFIVPEPAIVQ